MIQSAAISNFKALKSVQTTFERLTVFVGPNASGKTSLLEAIHDASELTQKSITEVFPAENGLTSFPSGDEDIDIQLNSENGSIRFWKIESVNGQRSPAYEISAAMLGGGSFRAFDDLTGQERRALQQQFASKLLQLEPYLLGKPSYSDAAAPELTSDGYGLASVLAFMKLNDTESFAAILQSLQSVIPIVKDIRFNRARIERQEAQIVTVNEVSTTVQIPRHYWGEELVFDTVSANDVPAALMSEGTLLVLGILTVIHRPSRPRVILLDDIDRGLHPRAQVQLVGVLRELLQQHEDLQIIATSHSPYLLDALRPEEIRLMNLSDAGATVCLPLSAHPEFERWKEVMSPGEFWSHVGEEWTTRAAATKDAD